MQFLPYMTKLLSEYLWKLMLFTSACIILQYLVQTGLYNRFTFYIPLWQIHVFLTLLTLLGYLLLLFVYLRDREKTGFAFIAIGFLKMLAAVLFLYPLIYSGGNDIMAQVLAFFVPYFLYLGFDTFFTIQLISKK